MACVVAAAIVAGLLVPPEYRLGVMVGGAGAGVSVGGVVLAVLFVRRKTAPAGEGGSPVAIAPAR